MTTAAANQASFVQARLGEIKQIEDQVRALESLSERQLHWQPSSGGWSIGQVLEHLVLSNRDYLGLMQAAVEKAPTGAGAAGEWRPSLMGGLLIRAMQPTSSRKAKAPRLWQPGAPRPEVLAVVLQSLDEVRALLEESRGLDLGRVRLHSPVSRLIRLNLGDGFMILSTHMARHLGQIEGLKARADFPA